MKPWQGILVITVICTPAATVTAADEHQPADEEFIEFMEYLGTLDRKNDGWDEFFDSFSDPDKLAPDQGSDKEARDHDASK